jgi:hypothetical protein
MRRFRPRDPAGAPSAVRRWGSRAEAKARGGVDARASPSSRPLEYGAMALATDGAGGCGRASRSAESYLTVRRARRSEKTSLIVAYRGPQ